MGRTCPGWLSRLALAGALLVAACSSSNEDAGVPSDRPLGLDPAATAPTTSTNGAGATGTTEARPAPVDTCLLLTDGEVAAATGGRIERREKGKAVAGDPTCTWRVAKDDPALGSSVILTAYADGALTFEADRDEPGSERVEGLGEGAYWQAPVAVLNVLVGPRNLTVQVVGLEEAFPRPAKEVAIGLARLAIGRVPAA